MKTLWSILSIAAIANLFALIGLVGYLGSTGRLDATRMKDIRNLFQETTADRDARIKEAKASAERDAITAGEDANKGAPPVTAADALELKIQQSQVDATRLESLKRDVRILQETLRLQRAALDDDRKAFDRQKQDFDAAREAVRRTESDAQFKKALATIEGLKADKAKATLQTLIDQKQFDQVISYLNAMQERTRTKIMDEFVKADPKMAAELLERLRTRGMSVAGVGDSP